MPHSYACDNMATAIEVDEAISVESWIFLSMFNNSVYHNICSYHKLHVVEMYSDQ